MYTSACYWARVRKIFYAGTVEDAREFGNFDDDIFYQELQKAPSERTIPMLHSEADRAPALLMWREFQAAEKKIHY